MRTRVRLGRRGGALLVVALLGIGACASPVTRDAVRDNYRKALVESGEDPALAKCLTDRFFEHRSNADVRAFQKRAHLTAEETQEFARLATLCAGT
jgi:hypothetical protein